MDIDCCTCTLPPTHQPSIFKPGRPAYRGVVGTLSSTPFCVSGLARSMAVRGHLATGCGSYIPYIRQLDACTPRSCCVAYFWSARLLHVYCHVIIPPRPSPFLALSSPTKLKCARETGKAWNRGYKGTHVICSDK